MTKYNPYNMPGYGDACTWPPYSGNPNDPRAPEPPEDDDDYEECDDGTGGASED